MKNPLEDTHKYCEICGEEMAVVEHVAPSRYSRVTGKEIKGNVARTWECPNYKSDTRHDRELLP